MILKPDQVVLSKNLFFKRDVLLLLVTGEFLQNTVDVTIKFSKEQLYLVEIELLLSSRLLRWKTAAVLDSLIFSLHI